MNNIDVKEILADITTYQGNMGLYADLLVVWEHLNNAAKKLTDIDGNYIQDENNKFHNFVSTFVNELDEQRRTITDIEDGIYTEQ